MAVFFAIECKNLKTSYPLVVQRMPRRKEESFHELIYSKPKQHRTKGEPNTEISRLSITQSFYAMSEHVGKACQQVGKSGQDMRGDNSEIYDKWTQAINSAHCFLAIADQAGLQSPIGVWVSILPVPVVPEGTLWIVDYDENGTRLGDPSQSDRVPFYLDASLRSNSNASSSVSLSHLEICTLPGLLTLLTRFKAGFTDETLFDIRQ